MGYLDGLDIPASIKALTELTPIEDIILTVLRERIPDFDFRSLIPDLDRVPFAQVRRLAGGGAFGADPRFGDSGRFAIHVFTKDPDGDEKGALISDGIRVALRDAAAVNWGNPGIGWIVKLQMDTEPIRKSDWATSSGPVQYADLPAGHWRYETGYSIQIRKAVAGAPYVPPANTSGDGLIEVGEGVPTSTPLLIGELYYDEDSGLLYRYEV